MVVPPPPQRLPLVRPSSPHAVSNGGESGETAAQTGGPAPTGTLRVSNWPLYMADGFVAAFQTATGVTVDYKEDFNDNEQWFAKVRRSHSRKKAGHRRRSRGPHRVRLGARVHGLGWLNEISDAGVPNRKNLRKDLLDSKVDPGRKYLAPYMSGLVGIAYNKAATGREITKIEDLWDPAFKGRVSLLSDTQDGLGMIMPPKAIPPKIRAPRPCRRPST